LLYINISLIVEVLLISSDSYTWLQVAVGGYVML